MLPIKLKSGQIYKNQKTKMTFICSSGHTWETYPRDILNHLNDCPCCRPLNYSKKAIKWLDTIAFKSGKVIQHAENGGEYKIPNTRYHADGYCIATNTIYEFYGDKFHGNLKVFNQYDNCHPFNKKLIALDLYNSTIYRENYIKSLGYNLISIWESDYDNIS